MVQNAKDYNLPGSAIVEDAERLRKTIYNFMKLHNPEYSDKNYAAIATPIPEAGSSLKISMRKSKPIEEPEMEEDVPEPAPEPKTNKRKSRGTPHLEEEVKEPKETKVVKSIEKDVEDDGPSFVGKSLQEAQEQLVNEMINHEEKGYVTQFAVNNADISRSGLKIFTPFVMLPSRELVDYYRVIRQPTSLNGLMKRVKGIHGRKDNTGLTDFNTWDAFENEVSKVWQNARVYNEDESEIWMLAGELQVSPRCLDIIRVLTI